MVFSMTEKKVGVNQQEERCYAQRNAEIWPIQCDFQSPFHQVAYFQTYFITHSCYTKLLLYIPLICIQTQTHTHTHTHTYIYCYCCSVTQACPTLCDPMDCSMPGHPVLHHLLEFAQVQGKKKKNGQYFFASYFHLFIPFNQT